MMDFFCVWEAMKRVGIEDSAAISAFLNSEKASTDTLNCGSPEELESAFSVLHSTPIERFFEIVQEYDFTGTLLPSEVLCFSNFENGAVRLLELLEFEPDGISYSDAGYQLMSAVSEGARVKYGETHAKLAAAMNLVIITEHKPAVVRATPWGMFLAKYALEEKQDVLKKLLLREKCVKVIISRALRGMTCYRDAVTGLAATTATRRRTNIKWLVEYIMNGTDREDALSRIDWEL